MKNSRIRFTGNLTLSELIKISTADGYNVVKSDENGIITCSHQGSRFLPDGTYIAVHAFRMREQTKSGKVERFNEGLIDVRVDEDPEDRGRLSIYITVHY